MVTNNIDNKTVAKKIIINSLKIEESLINLLRLETKILKRKSHIDLNNDEVHKINRKFKYFLYYLITINDRIDKCLDIIQKDNEI